VTEQEGGEALFLSGWIGEPLTRAEWRRAAAALIPRAQIVRFERRMHGRIRQLEIQLIREQQAND
jgi:hypothetical protein